MHLLIGAGNNRQRKLGEGDWISLVTLDMDKGTGCDVVHDLDVYPYPFEANTFTEVHAYDVIEHLGRQGDWRSFFALFDEIWRILKPDGRFYIITPNQHSKWAWGDPGHTRVVTPEQLGFLNRPFYARNVGRTPMTDYRPFFKSDWEPRGDVHPDHYHYCLTAVKPART